MTLAMWAFWMKKSTFKKPILKKLIGRTNDVALLPSGKKSPGLTFYYVTKSIVEDDGNVKEFIIRQTKIDTFEIDYVSETELTTVQIKRDPKSDRYVFGTGLAISRITENSLLRNARGKLKQFISELSLIKLTIVAGARPNFMKIAPLIHQIQQKQKEGKALSFRLIHTGQHYDKNLSDTFFEELNIPKPNANLQVGGGTQSDAN